ATPVARRVAWRGHPARRPRASPARPGACGRSGRQTPQTPAESRCHPDTRCSASSCSCSSRGSTPFCNTCCHRPLDASLTLLLLTVEEGNTKMGRNTGQSPSVARGAFATGVLVGFGPGSVEPGVLGITQVADDAQLHGIPPVRLCNACHDASEPMALAAQGHLPAQTRKIG